MPSVPKLIDIDFSKLSIQLKSRYKSSVWQHFGYLFLNEDDGSSIIVSNDVYCNLCFQQQKLHCYKGSSSSTNLQRHLVISHKIDVSSDFDGARSPSLLPVIKLEPASLIGYEIDQRLEESNLSDFSETRLACTSTSRTALSNNLTVNLALMCCKDLLSFDVIDGEGFRQFLVDSGAANEKSLIPSALAVSTEALVNIHNLTFKTVSTAFKESQSTVAMTSEEWKSDNSSYETIRFFFSNEAFEQVTLSMPTTINQLQAAIKNDDDEMLKKIDTSCHLFNLLDKSVIVIDESVHSCERPPLSSGLTKIYRQYCVAHALNNLVNINGLSKTLRGSNLPNNLYKYFSDWTNVSLQVPHLKAAIDHLKAFIDCFNDDVKLNDETNGNRFIPWNLLLVLLENVDVKVCRTDDNKSKLSEINVRFWTEENRKEIPELLEFLQHMGTAFEVLNGSPYTSIAPVLLLKAEVQRILASSEEDCKLLKSIKRSIEDALSVSFPITELHVCAALLDPTQRGWSSVQEYLVSKHVTFVDFLTSMLKKYTILDDHEPNEESKSKTYQVNSESTDVKLQFLESFSEPSWKKARLEILTRHVTCSESTEVEREVQQYMCSFFSGSLHDDPLLWWKEQKDSFPKLSKLAKIVLAIPAGCCSIEKIISCSLHKTPKLSFESDNLIKMLFIRDNCHLLESSS